MKKSSTQTPDVAAWLKAGEWGKVEKLLESYAGTKTTPPSYLNLFALYAKVNNHLNRQYLKQMQATMAVLKKMHTTEAKVDQHLKIAGVREKIKKIKK